MDFSGRLIQGTVFNIGASCGVVIEINCPNRREAAKLRQNLQMVVDAAIQTHLANMEKESGYTVIGGQSLEEVISEITQNLLRSE